MRTEWITIDPERDARTPEEVQVELEQWFYEKYGLRRASDIMRLDGWVRSEK